MADRSQQRIITLQKALKIARDALCRIENGCRDPEGVAQEAAYEIMRLERPAPIIQSSPTP